MLEKKLKSYMYANTMNDKNNEFFKKLFVTFSA